MMFHNLLSALQISILEFDQEIYNKFPLGVAFNYFGLLIEGKGRFRSNYCDFTIEPGEIVYIPRGCVYSSHWTSDKKIRFYSLGFRFLEPEKQEGFLLQKLEDPLGVNQDIEKMYAYTAGDAPEQAVGLFYYLYAKACKTLKKDILSKKYLSVYPAVEYIRKHSLEEVTVSQLAEMCHMSEPYFYPVFKAEMGCSPIRYKNQLKCMIAVELLLAGDDTLEEICDKLHISSPSFLRRLLKQETGKTPRQIRKEKYNI